MTTLVFLANTPEGVDPEFTVVQMPDIDLGHGRTRAGYLVATLSNGKRYRVKRTYYPMNHHVALSIKIDGRDWSVF